MDRSINTRIRKSEVLASERAKPTLSSAMSRANSVSYSLRSRCLSIPNHFQDEVKPVEVVHGIQTKWTRRTVASRIGATSESSSTPCHAWRFIPGLIGPQGEADMQATPELIDVDVGMSR
jgi:hypothetical protein